MAQTVAIVIPVLNERYCIEDTLANVLSFGADEIIVVDGNSIDGTYEFVKQSYPHVKCLRTPYANRAFQMNEGSHEVLSDILLFMHADVRLPKGTIDNVKSVINDGFIAGGFRKQYCPSNLILKVYGFFLNHVYFGFFNNIVGSNAIFLKRDLFKALKGFPMVEFMEDVLFSKNLKRQGRIGIVKQRVVVSSRRYFKNGIIKQLIRNLAVIFCYQFLKMTPKELKQIYSVNLA